MRAGMKQGACTHASTPLHRSARPLPQLRRIACARHPALPALPPPYPPPNTPPPKGVQFDQNDLSVRLGDIPLMEGGQPLAFDAKVASKYLKDTTAVHGTVFIYVGVGKGPGKGGFGEV